jgi:hypothetical protein
VSTAVGGIASVWRRLCGMVLRHDLGGHVPIARRIFVLVALLGLVWMAAATAYSRSQPQFYVGDEDGTVTIFRGQNAKSSASACRVPTRPPTSLSTGSPTTTPEPSAKGSMPTALTTHA